MKFNHIGIFAKNLKEGKKYIYDIFDIKKVSKEFHDKELKVSVQFFSDTSGITYEIVSPFGKNNPVDKVLKQNKNILNHVAYTTKLFNKEVKKLRKKGFAPLGKAKKAVAFNNAKVIFFITPLNFIIEIIEEKYEKKS